MLKSIASLKTRTTSLEVVEAAWPEPVETVSRLDSPTLTLLIYSPGYVAEAAYVEAGRRKLSKVGRVLFIPPDREMLGRGSRGTYRMVSCSFERAYCESTLGSLAHLSRTQLLSCLDVPSSFLPAALLRLMREALHPGCMSDALVESIGRAMLVELAQTLMSPEIEALGTGRLTTRHRQIIDDYLATVACEAPSVVALAAACGWSARYFAQVFREDTGQPISQYIKSIQLVKAQEYLLETELTLKEIAFRLGYGTPSNFSVAFRAGTGETPGKFRACHRPTGRHRTHVLTLAGRRFTSLSAGGSVEIQSNLPIRK